MDNRLLVVFSLAVAGLAFLAWSLPVDSAMIIGGRLPFSLPCSGAL